MSTPRRRATSFHQEVIEDPVVRDLATRVSITTDPQMSMQRSGYPCATVCLGLEDGRVLTDTTIAVRGDAANPVPYPELVDKFTTLASEVLGMKGTRQVLEAVDSLPAMKDVKELAALLAAHCP